MPAALNVPPLQQGIHIALNLSLLDAVFSHDPANAIVSVPLE
jgi:hypothetical protein